MCHQRLSVGEAPACVQSCPNEAIKIKIVPVGQSLPTADDVLVPSSPSSAITLPTTQYVGGVDLRAASALPQDHNMDEVAESHWPLAVMLVMTQISVGVLASESIASTILGLLGYELPPTVPLAAAVTAFVIGNLGLGLAPLHLGQPLRMWRVFLGLRTSWLSREAVVLGKYMGVLSAAIGVMALPLVWDWIPESIQAWIPLQSIPTWAGRALLLVSILIGFAGLYCSAMIYIATKRKLWRPQRTLPRFFGTALVSGPITVATIYAYFEFTTMAGALAMVTVVSLVWKLIHERSIYLVSGGDSYDLRSKRLIQRHLIYSALARVTCGVLAIVFAISAIAGCLVAPMPAVVLSLIAVALMIVGENLERLLYFRSVVYDRMPGTL